MIIEPQTRRIDLDPLEPVERPLLRFPRVFRPRVQANGLGDLVTDASEGLSADFGLWKIMAISFPAPAP